MVYYDGPLDEERHLGTRNQGIAVSESLTKREKEVVLELLDGGRVSTIAALFGISPRTVSNHLKKALWKLDVHS